MHDRTAVAIQKARALLGKEFDESKHPRAENGQFGSGGGGAKPRTPAQRSAHADSLSSDAWERTRAGERSGAATAHREAAQAHQNAAAAHAVAGDAKREAYHREKATTHFDEARRSEGGRLHKDFDESKHPRDEHGRFGSGGGGGAGKQPKGPKKGTKEHAAAATSRARAASERAGSDDPAKHKPESEALHTEAARAHDEAAASNRAAGNHGQAEHHERYARNHWQAASAAFLTEQERRGAGSRR